MRENSGCNDRLQKSSKQIILEMSALLVLKNYLNLWYNISLEFISVPYGFNDEDFS